MLIWIFGVLAVLAAFVGLTVAVRQNRIAIRNFWAHHRVQMGYAAGVLGGCFLLVLLIVKAPLWAFAIGAVVAVFVATVRYWTSIRRFLRDYWFRIIASAVLVAAVVLAVSFMRSLAPATLLIWTVVMAIFAAIVVWWRQFWGLIRGGWRTLLVLAVSLILVVAFVRVIPSVRVAVVGFWSEVTAPVPTTVSKASTPPAVATPVATAPKTPASAKKPATRPTATSKVVKEEPKHPWKTYRECLSYFGDGPQRRVPPKGLCEQIEK